eukprot:Skav234336  [mRNA]  locus=scaffold306:432720:433718:+ [translate_table: standard]
MFWSTSAKEKDEKQKEYKQQAFDGIFGNESTILHLKFSQWTFSPKEFAEFSNKYSDLSAHARQRPPFFILSGPAGTGKTEIAQRVARFMGVSLVIVEPGHIQCQEGEPTSKRLQRLADQIKKTAPCVVLFDEIDHLTAQDLPGGEAEAARSQFRQLVDGPTGVLNGRSVLIIGTTNKLEKLEPDMVSRAQVLHFQLPDITAASKNIERHARHLLKSDHKKLAKIVVDGELSHRDIRECTRSILLRAKSQSEQEPPISWYEGCFRERMQNYNLLKPEKPPPQGLVHSRWAAAGWVFGFVGLGFGISCLLPPAVVGRGASAARGVWYSLCRRIK